MARRKRIYEGKAKVLYEGPEPGTLVQYFKDDAYAFDRKGTITGKGVLNNRISEYLMIRLADIGIPTHLVRRLNMREQLVREVEIIPLTISVNNVAAGELAGRFSIPEGTPLPRSIVEYYYKSDELGNPLVSEEHVTAFGWATPQELDEIIHMSLRVNDFLSGLFYAVGIRLVDFSIEYGRLWEDDQVRVVLADEISPDNCRLWGRGDQRDHGQGPFLAQYGWRGRGLSGSRPPAGNFAGRRRKGSEGPDTLAIGPHR